MMEEPREPAQPNPSHNKQFVTINSTAADSQLTVADALHFSPIDKDMNQINSERRNQKRPVSFSCTVANYTAKKRPLAIHKPVEGSPVPMKHRRKTYRQVTEEEVFEWEGEHPCEVCSDHRFCTCMKRCSKPPTADDALAAADLILEWFKEQPDATAEYHLWLRHARTKILEVMMLRGKLNPGPRYPDSK